MMIFHATDGLFFTRNNNGSVTITKTDGKSEVDGGTVFFKQSLDAGGWISAVLSMSAFGERPGDFYAWMRHHHGKEDILAGKRVGENRGGRKTYHDYREW